MEGTKHIDGLNLFYRMDGSGSGPLTLLAGPLGGDITIWDDLVSSLTPAGYQFIRYDQRGHGKSSIPSSPCTFERLADDAAELLDALNIDKISCFCGDSMGAATAFIFSLRHPGRAERLILCDTPVAAASREADPFEPRLQLALKGGMGAIAEETMKRWLSTDFIAREPTKAANIHRMARDTPTEGYEACIRALQNFDLQPHFGEISVPTMVIVGANDGVLPGTMKKMANTIPMAEFHEIPDAGHVPMVDQPQVFVELFKKWVCQ